MMDEIVKTRRYLRGKLRDVGGRTAGPRRYLREALLTNQLPRVRSYLPSGILTRVSEARRYLRTGIAVLAALAAVAAVLGGMLHATSALGMAASQPTPVIVPTLASESPTLPASDMLSRPWTKHYRRQRQDGNTRGGNRFFIRIRMLGRRALSIIRLQGHALLGHEYSTYHPVIGILAKP